MHTHKGEREKYQENNKWTFSKIKLNTLFSIKR